MTSPPPNPFGPTSTPGQAPSPFGDRPGLHGGSVGPRPAAPAPGHPAPDAPTARGPVASAQQQVVDQAGKAAARQVTGGLVPKAVTDKVGGIASDVTNRLINRQKRKLRRYLAVIVVVFMGAGGGLIGLAGEDEATIADTIDAESDDASPTIRELGDSGQAFIAAYQQAAAGPDVPWAIVSAIAATGTEHGRRSPYDQVDRDPTRPAAQFQSNTFGTGGTAPIPVDGIACPLERSYFIDSWGFARPGGRGHQGVDMFAARGVPIYAITDGTVVAKGINSLGGQRLGIVDPEGRYWYYAHLDSYAPGVEQGSTVTQRQVIGTVGNTGTYARFTPTHLHLGLYPGGRGSSAVNAYPLMASACAGLQFESQDASGTTVAHGPAVHDGHSHPAAVGADPHTMLLADSPTDSPPATATDSPAAPPPPVVPQAASAAYVSVYPTVSPPIGNPDLGQGLGPFLLTADAVETFAISDPNDVDIAAQGVARILDATASVVAEAEHGDHTWRPDPTDPDALDEFWGAVLADAADWFVSNQPAPQCATPGLVTDPAGVATAIESIWRCEAESADGAAGTLVVPTGWNADSQTLTSLRGSAAASRLTLDAIAVAERFSDLQPTDGEETAETAPACDPDAAGPVGIFPLPAGAADDLGEPIDRCDTLANIRTAASLVVNGFLTTDPDPTTDPVDPAAAAAALTGGWSAMPWVAGSATTAAALAANGPRQPLEPTDSCVTATRHALLAATPAVQAATDTSTGDSAAGDDDTVDGPAEAVDPVTAILTDQVLVVATTSPACAGAVTADGSLRADWPAAVADIAARFIVDLSDVADHDHDHGQPTPSPTVSALPTDDPAEDAADDATVLAGQVDALQTLADAAAAVTVPVPAPMFGTDAALSHLSPVPLDYPPTSHTPAPPAAPQSFDQQVLAAALGHGYGLHRDDPRWGDFSLIGQQGGGRGIVLVVDPANRDGGPLPADSPELGPITCGSPGRQARADVAELFNVMCTDAQAQGVTLTLGARSAYRSPADQAALRAERGAFAASGTSNHQRGTALDIAVAGDPDRHWLHDIVGCMVEATTTYRELPAPVDYLAYATAAESGSPACDSDELPIKRIQTYGLIFPLCTQGGLAAPLANPITIRCRTSLSPFREPWHAEPGIVVATTGAGSFGLGGLGGYVSAGAWAQALPESGQQWSGMIETAAAQVDIDVRILAGVAWAESAFRPDVITCQTTSSAGARGMFQFMPATAAGFGINPCDPEVAAVASARYLKELHAQFGRWDYALAGYNWGPGNMRAYLAGTRPNWPAETRNYVAKITDYVQRMGGQLS